MHPCVPGIGGTAFIYHGKASHFLSDCHLKKHIMTEISCGKEMKHLQNNNPPITTVQKFFALEIGTLHVGWSISGDGGGFFSKGADGLLCSCADDGKLRFFGADVVPQLEPMIVMDGMTLDRYR